MDRRFQLRIIHFSQAFGLNCLPGIGPEIAVVEIEQQLHSLRFRAFRQRQRAARSLSPPP
jgi:hypothetical protein